MTAQLTHQGTQATNTLPTAPASTGRLRSALHQIRLTVAEMNYAARRVAETQAPWAR
jgi:hypothetical protein